jgi:predicted DNA-binding WGR domain protein
MKVIRKEVLRLKDSKTDKVYEIEIVEGRNEHFVNYRYGKTGGNLREGTKTKTRVAKKKAQKIFDDLVKEKTKKGYKAWNGEEPNDVETIISVLKNTGEVLPDTIIDPELNNVEGSVDDVLCCVLESLLPEKCINYPSFDGGWVGGTVVEDYKNLITSLVSKVGDIEISGLKATVNDESLPEDEQEIEISFEHKGSVHSWTFMMDDQGIYFNGVTKWITSTLDEAYLYISDDTGLYGYFLSEQTIEQLKNIGVSPLNASASIGAGGIDLVGKYISFAVLKNHPDIIEEWVDYLEIIGAFPQIVINSKTDYVIYGDLDQKNLVELNDDKLLDKAKKEGKNLLAFWSLQDLVGQFDY